MADLTLKSGTPTGNPPAGYIKLFIGDDGRLTGRDSTGASVLVLGGSNTGDQTITLSGDVTGSGSGSFAATIAAGAVSNAKQAQMPALTPQGQQWRQCGDARRPHRRPGADLARRGLR